MKNKFTEELHTKGWTLITFAEHCGQPLRNIARIAANPKGIHWIAIRDGLPSKQRTSSRGEWGAK